MFPLEAAFYIDTHRTFAYQTVRFVLPRLTLSRVELPFRR